VRYATDPLDIQSTGLGFEVFFDSSVLTFLGVEVLETASFLAADSTARNDSENRDEDATTDSFVGIAWAAVGGDFPAQQPADLVRLRLNRRPPRWRRCSVFVRRRR
jgi:hypothetical protein